jgi:ABC-type transport system involved in multi-copper enzyme maturation permease subunit
MVWIALGLLALALAYVLLQTRASGWEKSNWRWPRGSGPTYQEYLGALTAVHAFYPAPPVAAFVLASGGLLQGTGFVNFSNSVIFAGFVSFLLPVWSLSFATEAIGGERETRSLVWLLTRPMPRSAIYLAKFTGMLPWALGLSLGGFALLCVAAGEPGWIALDRYWPAVLCGSLAYSALFCLIGATFRRPAVVGIVYSFFLEAILGNMPRYFKRVSVGFYVRCMMFEGAQDPRVAPDNPIIYLPVDGTTACLVLVGLTVVLLVLGVVIFSRTEYVSQEQ